MATAATDEVAASGQKREMASPMAQSQKKRKQRQPEGVTFSGVVAIAVTAKNPEL